MSDPPAIPLTRLDDADPELMDELLAAVERVGCSSARIGGEEAEALEAELAAHCGTRHAVGASSGTGALVLALRALDVGPGDEVIVPANAFAAVAEAVTLVGATPRFVDVDRMTALVTARLIEHAIRPATRCVIPVHLYGRTADMDSIMALARDAGIAVVEDASHAQGAWVGAHRAGSVGDVGCFSLHPATNLGAWGDGGCLVTDDAEIAGRVRRLRSPGATGRLDPLQAAIVRIKLRRLDAGNDGRRRVGAALCHALRESAVRPPTPVSPGGDHVFHRFVVTSEGRERLRGHLAGHGVATAVHYPQPIHRTRAYAPARPAATLLATEWLAARIVSLPMHPAMSVEEIERVAGAVQALATLDRAA